MELVCRDLTPPSSLRLWPLAVSAPLPTSASTSLSLSSLLHSPFFHYATAYISTHALLTYFFSCSPLASAHSYFPFPPLTCLYHHYHPHQCPQVCLLYTDLVIGVNSREIHKHAVLPTSAMHISLTFMIKHNFKTCLAN